jgi:uncharacterized lipoprotein YbaY
MKTLQSIAIALAITTILTACSNDNQATPVNEEELITTNELYVTESNTFESNTDLSNNFNSSKK